MKDREQKGKLRREAVGGTFKTRGSGGHLQSRRRRRWSYGCLSQKFSSIHSFSHVQLFVT